VARYHGKLSQSFRGFMLTPIPRGMNWAKLFPRDGEPRYWHPLEDHCIDVAACAETLLNLPIVRTRLAGLAAVAIFPEGWSERLAALAFIHDFGKANRLAKGSISRAMFAGKLAGDWTTAFADSFQPHATHNPRKRSRLNGGGMGVGIALALADTTRPPAGRLRPEPRDQ